VEIRPLQQEDIVPISEAFARIGWNKPACQYVKYLQEQECGERQVFVAFQDSTFLGYLTVVWESHYPPLREAGIPEIVDFNVLPEFRKQGIGSCLMDRAEALISERSEVAGIGVGMDSDYGAAQRLYVKRGYIPDGRGLSYEDVQVVYGQTVTVDDSLVLHFTKRLR
jgi:GNAT superfamily N-acetyltransferase